MTSIFSFFLTWWLRSARYRWSRFRRKFWEDRYLETSLPTVTSLEDITNCLHEVKWTRDGLLEMYDVVSYPQAVWYKKEDDCDGFAVLASALLQQWQPDSEPVLITAILRPVKHSHTVCVFSKSEQELAYFDNYTLREGNYHTYADIANAVKGNRQLVCWDVVNPVTLETIEFHKNGY